MKEYDFNREQYGALASKNLKELVGRRSDRTSGREGFGEMYKELLDGSCLSLMSESDWRRLIEKKEVNYSQLTDYYKRQVHRFYEGRGRELVAQINKLVISAYGKTISADKKTFSGAFRMYIKSYGKQQFLGRSPWAKESSPDTGRPPGPALGSSDPASQARPRQHSASAEKHSALRFRRFGKHREHYKKVVRLLLEYFAQVKEFAYKLDRHLDLFLQINHSSETGGWFQFKSMVYSDLMQILFRDSKVAAFLAHLDGFFERNAFYAARFEELRRNLVLVENHLTGNRGKSQNTLDCATDGQQIMKAVTRFRRRRNSRRLKRSRHREIGRRNRERFAQRNRRLSSLGQQIMSTPGPPLESDFAHLHRGLLACLRSGHKLLFCSRPRRRPTNTEAAELPWLSLEELAKEKTLKPAVAAWFVQPVECVCCKQIYSLRHVLTDLGVSLPKRRSPPRDFGAGFLGKAGAFPRNRESQAYSLTQAKIVQDDLKSPSHSRVDSRRLPRQPQNAQTFKKRKRRKRRKKAKKGSASLHKSAKGAAQTPNEAEAAQLFAQLTEQTVSAQQKGFGAEGPPKEGSEEQGSQHLSAKDKKIQNKTREMLKGALRGLEVWADTVKKLGVKRRKDERSRKKGQRRNKKLRMNEDLKAMKAYQEWKKALASRKVGQRHSAEGVWAEVRKSLLIQKRF